MMFIMDNTYTNCLYILDLEMLMFNTKSKRNRLNN